jgi:hypothetical protein
MEARAEALMMMPPGGPSDACSYHGIDSGKDWADP